MPISFARVSNLIEIQCLHYERLGRQRLQERMRTVRSLRRRIRTFFSEREIFNDPVEYYITHELEAIGHIMRMIRIYEHSLQHPPTSPGAEIYTSENVTFLLINHVLNYASREGNPTGVRGFGDFDHESMPWLLQLYDIALHEFIAFFESDADRVEFNCMQQTLTELVDIYQPDDLRHAYSRPFASRNTVDRDEVRGAQEVLYGQMRAMCSWYLDNVRLAHVPEPPPQLVESEDEDGGRLILSSGG